MQTLARKAKPMDRVGKIPPQMERARMRRAADDLLLVMRGCLASGCREWMACRRPDAERLLAEAVEGLRRAADSADALGYAQAVDYCSSMHLRVAVIYKIDCKGRIWSHGQSCRLS